MIWLRNTVLVVFALHSISAVNASDGVASTLLRAYSPSCPAVVTRQVQSSLGHIQGLMHIVRQMRDEYNCIGAGEILEMAQRYQRLYEDYEVYAHTRDDQRGLERKIQLYTSLLSDPSLGTSQQTFLEQELLFAQSDLITFQAGATRFSSLHGRQARGAYELVGSIENFFSSWSSNPQCFESGLGLWSSLVSNGLLASAAFAGPGTSLALASGAVVSYSLSQYLRNLKWNRALDRIDEIQWPTALRCVSQSLTDQYCQSREVERLVRDFRSHQNDELEGLEGIELLSRHMTQLDHWLQEVFAGSAITSEGDLINRERPILQAELLQKVRRYTETYGTIRQDTYARLSQGQERSDAIALGISNLVLIMETPTLNPAPPSSFSSAPSLENPIFISRDKNVLPYTLFDPTINRVPMCNQNPCTSLLAYVNDRGIRLSMEDWERALGNALNVIDETLVSVNTLRARTVSVDAFSVLVRANADHRGESNAIEGLEKIIKNADRIIRYLTELGCESRTQDCESSTASSELYALAHHRYFPQIQNVGKTKELTQTVLELIEEGFRPRTLDPQFLPEECQARTDNGEWASSPRSLISPLADDEESKSFEITSCITNILKLAERGNDVYFRKVRDMVSYELEARFLHGDFDEEVQRIVYSTRTDLVQSLVETYSGDLSQIGLSELLVGIETSKDLTQRAVSEFYRVFAKPIGSLLEESRDLRPAQKGDLCFRILPFLSEDDQDLMEAAYNLCRGVSLNFYHDGPTLNWNDFVARLSGRTVLRRTREEFTFTGYRSQSDRYCALRNYYRDNMLIEQQMRSGRKDDKDDKGELIETPNFLDYIL